MIDICSTVIPSPDQMEFMIEGMRNPKDSWDRSDSVHECDIPAFTLGENDADLMDRLCKAGPEHRKFMRMMPVGARITAPLYWWKEFDTYKVGTTANSRSTMHKIAAKEFELSDFSIEHLYSDELEHFKDTVRLLNADRKLYLESKKKEDWWQMIQLLPSSYNQTRNVMMNYEVVKHIYGQRKDHRLDEWRVWCKWALDLPYGWLIDIL